MRASRRARNTCYEKGLPTYEARPDAIHITAPAIELEEQVRGGEQERLRSNRSSNMTVLFGTLASAGTAADFGH